jgi:hypothetical protein
MKKIEVDESSYVWDCECCGSVYDSDFTVTIDDDSYVYSHDGHFGNGYWDGSDTSKWFFIVARILGCDSFEYRISDWSHSGGPIENGNAVVFKVSFDGVDVNGKMYIQFTEKEVADNCMFQLNYEDEYYLEEDHIVNALRRAITRMGYEVVETYTSTSDTDDFDSDGY